LILLHDIAFIPESLSSSTAARGSCSPETPLISSFKDVYLWVDLFFDQVEVDHALPQLLLPQKTVPAVALLNVMLLLVEKLVHPEGRKANFLETAHASNRTVTELFYFIFAFIVISLLPLQLD
jgi:hypothetical protein